MLELALAVAAAVGALFSSGTRPIDTSGSSAAMLRAATCGACHEAEYEEWRASRHAKAWTNGLFQRDYRRTPRAWCQNCHAPLDAQQAALAEGTDAALVDEGVGCAACHVRGGRIVARVRRDGSPHDTVVDEGYGSPAMCAGCHQFNFPRFGDDLAFAGYTDEPMQDTVAQFQRNPRAPESCLACHGGGAGHRFPGAHDERMLRRAVQLDLCRDGDALVAIVRNVGAGHNVPTGDVHRHLLVTAWYATAPADLRDGYFGRRYALADDGTRTTVWDSTIKPGRVGRWRVRPDQLGEPATAGEPINIELRYVYTEQELVREDVGEPTFVTLERRRVVLDEVAACTR